MTNREYYKEQILDVVCSGSSASYDTRVNKIVPCRAECSNCLFSIDNFKRDKNENGCLGNFISWCDMEYQENTVNWSKVKVDAKVLVKDNTNHIWYKRHFAKYVNGIIYTFNMGKTSWSDDGILMAWEQGKLADEDE